MEAIFRMISEQPEYYAWVFGIVNFLWVFFLYINKKRHDKELVQLKQSLDLDLERRKKVFEMKSNQYENYFKNIDEIHNRHRNDYHEIVLPIINEFNASYLRANAMGDQVAAAAATSKFSEDIGKLTRDGFDEVQVMRSQTNSLRLTASDSVASTLDELQELYDKLFEHSEKMIRDIANIALYGDQELARSNQDKLNELGEITKKKSQILREQMRSELSTI
ncbi:hypothetical protein DDN55_17260 [Vibrio cholerae]|uniref:hypothetical protein n=1 Tax=Vibrio TaxID=662 RepID=UPI000D648E2D|nr:MULTISPECIES: hypothetical protein [Vibrio]EGR4210723.1 hypothetical protein [Vibrio cholerae]MBM4846603.1 hypothetical protein [Vibrio parahaemolyticus]EKF9853936.1 hypothetical protein [Vibrio cholerae]MCA3928955.1 hypothetical protein [Vibrio vulnificus]PWF67242.1 hypothetical protein CBX98_24325 [Vibrio sp. T9]